MEQLSGGSGEKERDTELPGQVAGRGPWFETKRPPFERQLYHAFIRWQFVWLWTCYLTSVTQK